MKIDRELQLRLAAAEKSLLVAEQKLQQMILERQRLTQAFDWQVFQSFRKTVKRLLPEGSLRFTLMQALLAVPVAVKRHGFRAGLRQTKNLLVAICKLCQRALTRRSSELRLVPADASVMALSPHTEGVDVVVCVHNAPDDVRRCLSSVFAKTTPPYHLILVDDGSDEETAGYLSHMAEMQAATLIRNEKARGYTCAANQGMRASEHALVVLLNSDTIVTTGWLDRLIRCAAVSPKICAAGPLSNTASWQSVPHLFLEDGDWNDNPLPAGCTPDHMARILAAHGAPVYPRLPFLNGFCMLIKKRALKSIGLFDEDSFGAGYGEENDFALRAQAAGWELAVADDAYVFHAQSKSYSHERRIELARRSDDRLAEKHGTSGKDHGVLVCQSDRVMSGVRARAAQMFLRDGVIHDGLARHEGRRVLFLLPIQGAGGGGHVVVQEAAAMRRMGVDAQLVNLVLHRPVFEREYPNIDVPVLYVNDPERDIDYADYDAVIATHYMSVTWTRTIVNACPTIVSGYYIQDYEPYFYPAQSLEYMLARKSYLVPEGTRCFVKTQWVHDTLLAEENLKSQVIGPSIDSSLFRPRVPSRPVQPCPLRVVAMVRPITPRRAPDLTMRVLSRLAAKHGRSISVHIFGCSEADPDFLKLERDYRYTNWGVLDRGRMASLLGQMDIFADFSSFQAMGLTALEAMASGVAVVVPARGGAGEFARHEANALVIDTSSEEACFEAVDRLVNDRNLTLSIQQEAMFTAHSHFAERAALNILDELFPLTLKIAPEFQSC